MNSIKNVLIVESQNDAAFIRLLLDELGIGSETETVEIEHLHKFLEEEDNALRGEFEKNKKQKRGKEAIGAKLKNIKRDLERNYSELEKLGIILDFDASPNWNQDKNLHLVNTAMANAFGPQNAISKESEFVTVNIPSSGSDYQIQFQTACFFNKDSSGEGNLDTLLFEIRMYPLEKVPYADCLELWRDCVNDSTSTLKVTENTYAKIWLGNFLRAKAAALGKAGKSILSDFEAKQSDVIAKVGNSVFDLEHIALKPLRDYLLLYKGENPKN